jgi:hypothetical protein
MRLADFNLTQVAGDRSMGLCGRLGTKAEGRSWGASVRLDGARTGKRIMGTPGEVTAHPTSDTATYLKQVSAQLLHQAVAA